MRIKSVLSIILIIFSFFELNVIADDLNQEVFNKIKTKNWQEATSLAKQANNKILLKIVTSQKLQDSSCDNKFEEVVSFIQNNPNWPQNDILKAKAEKYINKNTDKKIIYHWFGKNKPLTGDGYKFYALTANKFVKDHTILLPIIKNGWVYGDFTAIEEKEYYNNWKKYLSLSDHIKRIDEHLWKLDVVEARRSLYLVDKNHQAAFNAEIAAIEKSGSTEALFKKIPSQYYNNGLLFRYLKYKQHELPTSQIAELFTKLKKDPAHSHELWRLQAYYARECLEIKDYKSAYKIASHILADQLIDLSDQEFLAGWIALRFLKKPDIALAHFERFNKIVKSPISVSRANYWLARTWSAKNNKENTKKFYKEATKYNYTYYGQLAKIELKEYKIILPSTPKIAIHHTKNIENNDIVKATKLLLKYGEPNLASIYAKAAINQAKNPEEIFLIAEIAKNSSTNPYYMVEMAKAASHKHVFIKNYAFPTPYKLSNCPIEQALTYAIIRQESVFNQSAVSSAKARGLMQLIEKTACQTAKSIGTRCNIAKLTTDPQYNIKLGTNHLSQLLNYYNDSYILSIAAYNAGSHNVVKWLNLYGDPRNMKNNHEIIDWIELIPFYETRNYVQRVLENIIVYRTILNKNSSILLKSNYIF